MDSEGYSQNGVKKLPSRFLDEIGVQNYERIGKISDDLNQEQKQCIAKSEIQNSTISIKKANDEVEHHIFGKGKIIDIQDDGLSYLIKFDNHEQPRTIVSRYFTDDFQNRIAQRHANQNHIEINTPEQPKPQIEINDTENDSKNKSDFNDFVPEEKINIPILREQKANADNENKTESPDDLVLKKQLEDSENLWKRDDVPKTGWVCQGVTDLGAPVGICQMCGYQIIRYVHHMYHKDWGNVDAGCICAGKMEGNIDAAKQRERDMKNKSQRKEKFLNRKWKTSRNGNTYIKIKDHIVVLYCRKSDGVWKYSIDNKFCIEIFENREAAKEAAFEALEQIISNTK